VPVDDTSGSTSEIPVSDTSQAEVDTTESEDDYVKPTVIEYDDGDTVVAFDPSTYSPGQLAPRFTPQHPYGFVTVTVNYEPGDEPQLDDGQYDPPVCAFDLSAQSYDSGAKYVLMLVAGLVLFFWLIQMIAQYRREGW